MTDQTNPTPEIIPPGGPAPRRRGWKTPLLVAGALAIGLTGAVATTAFSEGGFGPGMWHHGGGGWGPMGDRGPMDPAQMNARIEKGIKHLAIEIDATQDQQAKLITIVQSAVSDLRPLRDQLGEARQKGRELLVQPNLDRAAIETFRAQQMAVADQISKRVAQAVGDAAEVLTPEQRAKIGERLADGFGPHGFRGGWHRG